MTREVVVMIADIVQMEKKVLKEILENQETGDVLGIFILINFNLIFLNK